MRRALLALPCLLVLGCASSRAPAPLERREPVGVTDPGCGSPPPLAGAPSPPPDRGLSAWRNVLGSDPSVPMELELGPRGHELHVGDRTFHESSTRVFAGSIYETILRAPDGQSARVISWDTGTRSCGEVRIAQHAPVRGVWLHAE